MSPSLSNLSKTGAVSEVPSRGRWAYAFLSMYHWKAALPTPPPSFPHLLLLLPSVCRGITVQPRRGRSMPCLCQFKQGIELFTAICTTFTVWYSTQTGSLQVCKRVFAFICFEPLPGCRFWQLLSHVEDKMIHSSGFNVILHKVTRLLDVTLKMFGPWAIDHSQEIYSFPWWMVCVVILADQQIEHWIAAQLSHFAAGTRANISVSAVIYLRPSSSHFRRGTWFQYAIWPSNGSNMTITHLERPACQKPSQLMTGDGG